MVSDHALAEVGIIGGSGFYDLADDLSEVRLETPYGPPSDAIQLGEVAGRTVAFLPRHGRGHRFPPHRIPYRANLWALRSLGVRQVRSGGGRSSTRQGPRAGHRSTAGRSSSSRGRGSPPAPSHVGSTATAGPSSG
jgi:hypothetical protein